MRILGIDPGTLVTGFGVIEGEGNKLVYVSSGCIRTRPASVLPERLKVIYDGLMEAIELYKPEGVGVENIFHSQNVQSALKLGHARGVALLAAVNSGLPVAEYLPMEVKKSVVGTGAADKEQVQKMVQVILRYSCDKGYDASDALAVAICHFYSHRTLMKLQTREGRR